jgi:glycosyltransferase involved in cell wall biosynthesis
LKISAIIPTYNRRAHVLRAIDSVLAQTVAVDEVIVVDDGSTDGTADAIRDHCGARVTVLRQENAGVSAARNLGIREARGEWVAFLDSDDVWLPKKLERQFAAISGLNPGFGACFTDCAFTGDPNITRTAHGAAGLERGPEFSQLRDPRFYLLGGPPVMYAQTMLVLRSLLNALHGFDEAMPISEDLDLLFRLTFKTKICLVSTVLVTIDRTPSRPIALTGMYSRRDDRKYESLAWLYTKWLALPDVAGTVYEPRVRDLLREVYYDSTEAKVHDLKIKPAFHEISRLKATGLTYPSVIGTLLYRKFGKLRRNLGALDRAVVRPAVHFK